jgi:uncharacterized protein DUF3105
MGKGERERERLRQERIEAENAEQRSGKSRLYLGYGIAAALVVVVVVVVILLVSGGGESSSGAAGEKDDGGAHINVNTQMGSTNGVSPDERAGIVPAPAKVTDLKTAAKQAGCVAKLKLTDEGHTHIPQSSPEPNYQTSPPTSGEHVEPPFQQADGAYDQEPKAIDFVHSLEHGRMEIQYSPDLPEEAQLELKGLYDTMYGATLLFPNEHMPYQVAATTWTNLLGCKKYKGAITLDAIRAFGKETWGKYGSEPVFAFKFTGPTPEEPEEPSS